MQHVFLINPRAGKRNHTARIYGMAEHLRTRHGLSCTCLLTSCPGGAESLARETAQSGKPVRLYACGGGARSKVWLQIKADIWNREILPVKTEETGALGSAILGFAAVTGEKDRLALAKKFVQLGEPMQPDAARVEVYREKFQLYKQLRDFQVGSLLK